MSSGKEGSGTRWEVREGNECGESLKEYSSE